MQHGIFVDGSAWSRVVRHRCLVWVSGPGPVFIIEYMIDCVTGLQQWDSLMPAGAHVNAFVHNDKDVACGMKLGVKIL